MLFHLIVAVCVTDSTSPQRPLSSLQVAQLLSQSEQVCSILTYQPTNPSTYQPTSLPTYQPTNLPTYQPTNLPTYQPTNLPTHQLELLNVAVLWLRRIKFTLPKILKLIGKLKNSCFDRKLDGVGPNDTDPPTISFTTLSEKKNDILHETFDM